MYTVHPIRQELESSFWRGAVLSADVIVVCWPLEAVLLFHWMFLFLG